VSGLDPVDATAGCGDSIRKPYILEMNCVEIPLPGFGRPVRPYARVVAMCRDDCRHLAAPSRTRDARCGPSRGGLSRSGIHAIISPPFLC